LFLIFFYISTLLFQFFFSNDLISNLVLFYNFSSLPVFLKIYIKNKKIALNSFSKNQIPIGILASTHSIKMSEFSFCIKTCYLDKYLLQYEKPKYAISVKISHFDNRRMSLQLIFTQKTSSLNEYNIFFLFMWWYNVHTKNANDSILYAN